MPRFDVHQKMFVNGSKLSESKVRMSGTNAPNAAVNWVKMHGLPKADSKSVRILGNTTKIIEAEYIVGGETVRIELIPVDSKNQCKDCGYPSEYPNEVCYGECEENRNREELPMDIDDADDLIRDMM